MRPVESDSIRLLTKREVNALPATSARSVDVELCPDARVYSFCLSAALATGAPVPASEWLARLVLQDSEARVYDDPFSTGADLPGLAWPAYAKLEIAPGVIATLQVVYGHCR